MLTIVLCAFTATFGDCYSVTASTDVSMYVLCIRMPSKCVHLILVLIVASPASDCCLWCLICCVSSPGQDSVVSNLCAAQESTVQYDSPSSVSAVGCMHDVLARSISRGRLVVVKKTKNSSVLLMYEQ